MAEKKFWDTEKLIGEVEKAGSKNTFKFMAVTKNDKKYVAVSEWYVDKEGNERPKGGQTYPVDSIDDVVAMLELGKAEFVA